MNENPEGLLLVNGDNIVLGTYETKFKFICKKDEAARLARQEAYNEPSAQQIGRDRFDQRMQAGA